jgi:hypothetical protein
VSALEFGFGFETIVCETTGVDLFEGLFVSLQHCLWILEFLLWGLAHREFAHREFAYTGFAHMDLPIGGLCI